MLELLFARSKHLTDLYKKGTAKEMEKSIKPSLKDSDLLYSRPFETRHYEIDGRSEINGGIMPLEESRGLITRAFIIVNAGSVEILQINRKLLTCVCARYIVHGIVVQVSSSQASSQ